MHCNRHGRFDCSDPVCTRWYADHDYTVPRHVVGLSAGFGENDHPVNPDPEAALV